MSLLLFDVSISWANAPLINTSEVELLWWRGKNHFIDFLRACLNVCCLNIIIYFAIQCGEKLFIDRKIYLVDWQWTVFEVFWVARCTTIVHNTARAVVKQILYFNSFNKHNKQPNIIIILCIYNYIHHFWYTSCITGLIG